MDLVRTVGNVMLFNYLYEAVSKWQPLFYELAGVRLPIQKG
ncbi:hypothetical protein DI53_2066 [Sphingobacterium deserti]|uniref:Uncharacterized protein n=1 Tax=Sphingobacterium deserti TaxID=1229276 RepID=A0A0B8T104_9SPHI|nr:hypothetical protein DI53_2066 [Sphingobacterium deserti]